MNTKTTIETVYRVWDDDNGVCLNVGPDGDSGAWPEISTKDKKSEDYFGKIRLVLPPAIARNLGKALLKCADDCDQKSGKIE